MKNREFNHEWPRDAIVVESCSDKIRFTCTLSEEASEIIRSEAEELRKCDTTKTPDECLRRAICFYAYLAIQSYSTESFIAAIEALKYGMMP